MQGEIREIVSYVEEKLKPYLKGSLTLHEIIILPESSYYIIARINYNSESLEEVSDIENKFLPLVKEGIRVVVRPKEFEINDKSAINKINKKFQLYKDLKIKTKKKNPFIFEIEKLKEKIYKKEFDKNKILWEIEIKGNKINFRFLDKKSHKEAEKLIFLSEVALKKKTGLIPFLY
ncbi:MAG: hypothetical protein PHH17_00795 [Candidatus Pacebacteria bacterium]|nr:hypothetical protein [Candidatus Paceibacterota bacterium]MDD4466947.1 hypothetical protein [Candidatus Paceibacterota bacterium]MDD5445737.1 hypothetical protein [Candidatus Paceibacterota bacterium]